MSTGQLYVVATPIGNLEDFSRRACRILQTVDLILVEDTRHSARLFNHYAINTPVLAFHDHNEQQLLEKILTRLEQQESIALVSDAGTPLINDPGYALVRAAHARGIRVVPIPGPAAVITALSAAGLPTDRFAYEGFLPARSSARCSRLSALAGEQRTLVFYEVPHRIKATVRDMISCLGAGRQAVLAKELTKQFETIRQDTLAGLLQWLEDDPDHCRGEFVLVICGVVRGNEATEQPLAEAERILGILLQTCSVRDASNLAAQILGENKNRLYRLALTIDKKSS